MKIGYKPREDYIDICKVIAMFFVTWAHCAQQISGMMFPKLLLSKDSFISFNMAMFMIASGLVMNISKMHTTFFVNYFCSKVLRLLLPMTVWYLLLTIAIYPKRLDYWDAFWYLSAMFICLITIKMFAQVITSTCIICFSSILFLSIIPFPMFERSCYMIPFLWVGYALRFYINRIDIKMVLIMVALYSFLYYFWDVRYSIYISPFHICEIGVNTILSLLYRFLIGAIGGVAIISLIRIVVEIRCFKLIKSIAKYGQYTLVFYTMSFVLNAFLARLMWHVGVYLTIPGLLDITSFIISFLMMVLMYRFQKSIENNFKLCRIFGVIYRMP